MQRCALLPLVLLPFLQCGCVFLPVPNRTVTAWAVESRVTDAQTGKPVTNATVADLRRPQHQVTTDIAGQFRLGRVHQWHAAYLWGVLSHPLWPTECPTTPYRAIVVAAPGYRPLQIEFGGHPPSSAPSLVAVEAQHDQTFAVKTIALQRE